MFAYYLTTFIDIFFNIYNFILLARVLITWMPHRPHNAFANFCFDVTDPPINFIKNIIRDPVIASFAPIFLVITMEIVSSILHKILI